VLHTVYYKLCIMYCRNLIPEHNVTKQYSPYSTWTNLGPCRLFRTSASHGHAESTSGTSQSQSSAPMTGMRDEEANQGSGQWRHCYQKPRWFPETDYGRLTNWLLEHSSLRGLTYIIRTNRRCSQYAWFCCTSTVPSSEQIDPRRRRMNLFAVNRITP
jgi:hypothetical protein